MQARSSSWAVTLVGAAVLLACAGTTRAQGAGLRDEPNADVGACAGLSEQERRTPLLDSSAVVQADQVTMRRGKQMLWQTDGAELSLRAGRGDTAAWIERLARCQLSAPEYLSDANSPLAVAGAEARVFRAGSTLVLRITAKDMWVGREIWRRAAGLARSSR
ncbi:MAG: hypothetical protein IPL40_05145 [Proteobacteria bacterium]|nr:hypothetical protein [Pseudomonadota bacterium]